MLTSKTLRKPVVGVIVPVFVLLPILPALVFAQNPNVDACAQARTDAQENTSGIWYLAGCLGLTGILIAYLVEPAPASVAMIGKPPEWIVVYSDCYRSAAKSAQGKKAVVGCVFVSAVQTVISVALILIIAASEDGSSY